jgi:glycosyltransferase involved in cell wall biosynthesis
MRSVVLASCQGERFIGEQLDSIIQQLSVGDEIVVSDDASTDGTLEVVSRRADARIRVLASTVRVGYVRNFQRALEQARGDSIYFADQDDVWLPTKVAMLDEALRLKSCACSDAVVVDEHLSEIHPSFFGLRQAASFSAWSILRKPSVIGATLACRRQYLASLLPLPAGVPHDFWISFNAAWDGVLQVVSAPLILYRRHAAVSSPTATARQRTVFEISSERFRLVSLMARRRLLSGGTGRSSPA